jgi:hypothetical protein
MTGEGKDLKVEEWRALRRAFIAACEARGLDVIARVHPARGPDGKPLFMDSVALGPRHAAKALLVVTGDAAGSRLLTALLQDGVAPSPDARLVLVHALDPADFAGAVSDPAWSAAMLRAVMTEDLAKVAQISVLDLSDAGIVSKAIPDPSITIAQVPPGAAAVARIQAMLAAS